KRRRFLSAALNDGPSCRSWIAAAFAQTFSGKRTFLIRVASAYHGTDPLTKKTSKNAERRGIFLAGRPRRIPLRAAARADPRGQRMPVRRLSIESTGMPRAQRKTRNRSGFRFDFVAPFRFARIEWKTAGGERSTRAEHALDRRRARAMHRAHRTEPAAEEDRARDGACPNPRLVRRPPAKRATPAARTLRHRAAESGPHRRYAT
ncbi:polysaccharide deacetylase, partial [Burkholderia pseudomallei]|uniref:polysaccharide deacetylase n=1 Tax=Burkholderia pseudomallei TaxID=28450 RepID=UPI0018A8B25A